MSHTAFLRLHALLLLTLLSLLAGCIGHPASPTASVPPAPARPAPPLAFTDITREAGIQYHYVNGAAGQFYHPETFGPGCAFLDYDRDGWLDILLVNGDYWPGHAPPGAARPTLTLYHNDHNGSFTDVTAQAGLNVTLY